MSNAHAFPTGIGTPGMTQRQWYKGQALATLRVGDWTCVESGVQYCADYADKMLAEDIAFEQAQQRVDSENTSASR